MTAPGLPQLPGLPALPDLPGRPFEQDAPAQPKAPRPRPQPGSVRLTLRPPGRGNWHTVTVTLRGRDVFPLMQSVGDRVHLLQRSWRVVAVQIV